MCRFFAIRLSLSLIWLLILQSQSYSKLLPYEERPEASVYISVGDCLYESHLTPVTGKLAIETVFDTWKQVYKCNRIFWRGAQDELILDNYKVRSESPIYAELLDSMRNSYKNLGLNIIAVNSAHKRGMQIWAYHALFDYGGNWEDGVFDFLPPYYGRDELLELHPEFSPVDKHGHRRGGGTLCFAYPEARKALIKRLSTFIITKGYDGLMFYTYVENYSQRFNDEFGYNEPIVTEFKRRYGVDIRYEKFDKVAWHKLQGEYVTEFLKELGIALKASGKGLGVVVYNNRRYNIPGGEGKSHYPSAWADDLTILPAGNIWLDWEKWLTENIVTELLVYSDGEEAPALFRQMLDLRKNSGSTVKLSFFTPTFEDDEWNEFTKQGLNLVVGDSGVPSDRGYAEPQSRQVMFGSDPYAKLAYIRQMLASATENKAGTQEHGDPSQLRFNNNDVNAPVIVSDILLAANDSHLLVQRKAIFAIGQLKLKEGLPILYQALKNSEVSIRSAAIKSLAQVYDGQTAMRVVSALHEDDCPQFTLASATEECLAALPDTESLLALPALYDNKPIVRMMAAWSVARSPKNFKRSEWMPVLIDVVKNDSDMRVRYCAAWALERYKQSEAVEALLEALSDENIVVQQRATASIARAGSGSSEPKVIMALSQRFREYDSKSVRPDREWGWRVVGNALVEYSPDGRGFLENLLDNKTEDIKLRQLAFLVLKVPQNFLQYQKVTEEENDNIWALWPQE